MILYDLKGKAFTDAERAHAPFCVCCFLFYFPICPFWGAGRTVCSRKDCSEEPAERKRHRCPLSFSVFPHPSTSSKTRCSLLVSSFFVFFCCLIFFPFVFLLTTHTHAMVKLQSRRPQEATFPLPIEKKKCEGSAQMDLFIPVTVVTEAQTLCDDQGNKIEPHFGPTWPMDRLV